MRDMTRKEGVCIPDNYRHEARKHFEALERKGKAEFLSDTRECLEAFSFSSQGETFPTPNTTKKSYDNSPLSHSFSLSVVLCIDCRVTRASLHIVASCCIALFRHRVLSPLDLPSFKRLYC